MPTRPLPLAALFLALLLLPNVDRSAAQTIEARRAEAFPGTALLTDETDLASKMVDGIDALLLQAWDQAVADRETAWSSIDAAARDAWIAQRRDELTRILGLRDEIPAQPTARFLAPIDRPQLVGTTADGRIAARYVTWTAFDEVEFEGVLIEPEPPTRPIGQVIVIGDADQPIESLAFGLGATAEAPAPQFARRLAESGLRVLVVATLDRTLEKFRGRALQTRREFAHRPAFELGRTLVGYEVSAVLSARRWMKREGQPIAVAGWGEGGETALLAGALDPEFAAVAVSGSFGPHAKRWQRQD
ncbi:MAG TPA: hypothetical protein PLI18_16530 [Pirellulaceae bacterium]|nr:hypothetical protein [Pirellulaceae bacterium]